MSCKSCSERWKRFKNTITRKLFSHDCKYVQVGCWADKYYTSKPLMRCTICGQEKYVGRDD